MNINYKQPQFELFPGKSNSSDDVIRPKFFLANMTLTVENLVVLSILCIMLAVFAYSLGIERGKHVMALEFKQTAAAMDVKAVRVEANANANSAAAIAVADQTPVDTRVAVPVRAVTVVDAVKSVPPSVEKKPSIPDTKFKYTVQVASYADVKFARRAAVELNKKGFETLVMQKGKYAILCVGKFYQKNEAMAMISKLKPKFKDCLVRSM